jgi:hypothetical protein
MRSPNVRKKFVLAAAVLLPLLGAAVALFILKCLTGGFEKKPAPSYSQPQPQWEEIRGPMLSTRWEQGGPYAALAPGREVLGCWSVAFAQVLAFHHLQPKGRVSYKTRRGIAIQEALDSPVNWDRVVLSIGPQTSAERSLETARYCFNAALVVQKDFGSGEYMDVARIPKEVAEHYGCTVERVDSGLADTVISELRANRPLVAYFDDILDIGIVRNGHSAVLDGMARENGRLFVHVNFGWGGASDGWYDFENLAKERELLRLFRIVP